MKRLLFFALMSFAVPAAAQLKYLVEDFEGFADLESDLKPNGVFVFGNVKAQTEQKSTTGLSYSGQRCLKLRQNATPSFGGWGKGITAFAELEPNVDFLNFYLFQPASNGSTTIKVELQDDDNGNGIFEKDADDGWEYSFGPSGFDTWQLQSIPLTHFKDSNTGGDGSFNISYKKGRLLTFLITFADEKPKAGRYWLFDFICFSKGKLPTGKEITSAVVSDPSAQCGLGAWSKEGNVADFSSIATGFENNFKECDKKLGVIHFFQPFAVDGGNTQNFYPSVERINKIISDGYVPLITLEDHFVNANPSMKQPNLYSIVEGHFDIFFADWANHIRKVKGTVMLRILHEFNGDWYPWCISKNDNNPELLVKAFRRIHDIFKEQNVTNVRFIWCPNSTSFPQAGWNYIMDAYPGDEYVDYVALDIYNGAGKENTVWRSFRKEAIENYFVLTQKLPGKPLLVCEVASRERRGDESQTAQNKPGWIKDMSEALSSDMSKVRLLTWFNEKESFRVNSSPASQKAFLNYIMKNDHFKSGSEPIHKFLKP